MPVSADLSRSFEDTALQAGEELRILDAAGHALVVSLDAAVVSPDEAHAEIALALVEGCRAYCEALANTHGHIAQSVAGIAVLVDAERHAFDQREVPLPLDRLIGHVSKKAMRRRMELRAAHSIGTERLRLTLGRADRLAGLIMGQRQLVLAQRKAAETALSILARGEIGAPSAPVEGSVPKALGKIAGRDMLAAGGLVIEALNMSVRDLTLLMHKLGFDVEYLLDVYAVLLTFHRDRDAHALVADSYPHFADAVSRLENGILPGGRLSASRERADLSFVGRFGGTVAAS